MTDMTFGLMIVAYINFHFSIQSIIQQQVVSHAYAMRLHRMALPIIKITDVAYRNKVANCNVMFKQNLSIPIPLAEIRHH